MNYWTKLMPWKTSTIVVRIKPNDFNYLCHSREVRYTALAFTLSPFDGSSWQLYILYFVIWDCVFTVYLLKQYSTTQPGVAPKLVATFRSPTASFIRLVVTWCWARDQKNIVLVFDILCICRKKTNRLLKTCCHWQRWSLRCPLQSCIVCI